MRLIGFDPGLRLTGWGVIEVDGNRLRHVAHGVVRVMTTGSLAERLREALATNTIAGRGEAENRVKAAIAEVEQAQAAWKRLGPVPGDAGRELERRFETAARRVLDQRRR